MCDIPFEAVIFDFDYTLADASSGILMCANFALRELGLDAAPAERIKATVGLSLAETYRALTGRDNAEETQRFVSSWVSLADQVMNANTMMLSGVPMALVALHARRIPLAIVSTKYRYRIESLLDREGLRGLFQVIVGGEDVAAFKPDPQGLWLAADLLGVAPERCLYVGDSVVDGEAAQRAGMPFVGVLSGATRCRDLEYYGALAVIPSAAELPAWMPS